MATITVGPGQKFSTVSAAVAASKDGDVVRVVAGTYTNDFPVVNTRITLEGVGGIVHLQATVSPPNGKAIMTTTTDVTIDNFEFSGAAVPDGNGAGIRYEGGKLTLDHTYFHDNQDGLLSSADPAGTITILNSEFANNGTGDGLTHNLYVGAINTLTVMNSYFHDAVVGHEIKSRALNNVITNNRIADGPSGNGSYLIDLPNGGNATIQGNVLEKGPNAANPIYVSFGEEGGVHVNSGLSVSGNTVLNDYTAHIPFLVRNATGFSATIANNLIHGLTGTNVYSGTTPATVSGNTFVTTEPSLDTSSPYLPALSFTLACYAEGTRIQTERGETAVEDLRPGEKVMTLTNGTPMFRPVRWVGHRLVRPARHPRPETVYPVRITRDAFANGVPRRDLVLSPDHAIYGGGRLIAARQLINGMTIRQEESGAAIRYFHVECDTHTILLAEGLPAESYLDTGNRGVFANGDAPLPLHPDFAALPDRESPGGGREARSCAPFVVDEASVLPVWRRLAERALALGYTARARAATMDPRPRLRAGDRCLKPASSRNGRHVFVLPAGAAPVRLLSRAASPTAARPWLEDRRQLGVLVLRILLRDAEGMVDIPLDHPALDEGWWALERDGDRVARWTDGDALLPLRPRATPATLELRLDGGMMYPEVENAEEMNRQSGLPAPARPARAA